MSLRRRALLGQKQNLKFNQQIQNGNFEGVSHWAPNNLSITASENILTAIYSNTSKKAASVGQGAVSFVAGHKYLYTVDFKPDITFAVRTIVGSSDKSGTIIENAWNKVERIFTNSVTTSTKTLFMYYINQNAATDITTKIKNAMLIDLTAMYGSGNEPTTVEQVRADCMAIGRDLEIYQPYTPATE